MQKVPILRPVHPFPARMAPSIVFDKLPHDRNLTVLDPMAGSGTTLVTSRIRGYKSIGFDTDPLAVLIARTWVSNVDKDKALKVATNVLKEAKRRYVRLKSRNAFPLGANERTQEFVRFWFDFKNRKQLACLAREIRRVDPKLQNVLWCAFSKMIITKEKGVSRAMDVSHSRPHRVYSIAPVSAFDRFLVSLKSTLRASPFPRSSLAPKAKVRRGDARALPLTSESVDLIITSPPYLNAIDYLRGHKLSLVWMGYQLDALRELRNKSVGAEVAFQGFFRTDEGKIFLRKTSRLPERTKGILLRYAKDMRDVMAELYRVLVPGGRVVLVIGNSSIQGTYISNSRLLRSIADKLGFSLVSKTERKLPESRRYLPPPNLKSVGVSLGRRMRTEVILVFRK